MQGLVGEENFERAFLSHKGMPEAMVVWIMTMEDREEMYGSREEMFQEERKNKETKRKRKQKKEQKRKKKNAELRRRTKAMAIAYSTKEAEYYLEEREYHEEQYDDEQCAYYHQNYIEEMLNDIRKRLYQRSQPARTARHSRWEKPHGTHLPRF